MPRCLLPRHQLPWLAGFGFAATMLLGCEQLGTGSSSSGGAGGDAGARDGSSAATADAGIVGGGCGVEQKSGIELCVATSMCPNLVVDTQAMPSCGFRIRGGAVDLVCACGAEICPMGVFTSCAEATQLLATQTEQGVCVQLAEGRCVGSAASGATSSSSSSSSTSSTSGGSNPACDRQCMRDCGSSAGCASVCNCD